MSGSWSHLVGKYPERKKALVDLKEKCTQLTMEDLEKVVADKYHLKKDLERRKAQAENEYQAASEALLDRWSEDKTRSVKRDELGTLTRVDDVRARVSNMDQFKEWAIEHDLGDIIQPTVNANTLSSTVKELMTAGEELPEGVSLFTQSRVRVTKPKGAV